MKRWCVAVILGALAGPAAAASESWNFIVRLDGKPVGTHRFVIETAPDGRRQVSSTARFDVTFLGVPLYRYRHMSREEWQGGCLAAIEASTDDDGRRTVVQGRGDADGFAVDGAGARITGCLMTFAYWDAKLAKQSRLLDPGTGRVVPVKIERIGDGRRWRITGLPNPIEIEWDDTRWIALDTTVSGRHLSYRLQ